MRALRGWLHRLRGLFTRRRAEEDFAAQFESDRALYIDARVQAGATIDDARRAAALEFGSAASTTDAWRDQQGVPFLERLQRDVAFAFRLLRRNTAWAGVGVVSLALGAGAGAAVFSITAMTLLSGLSVPEPETLVALRWQGENKALTGFSDYGFVEGGILGSWFTRTFENSDTTAADTVFDMRAGATMPYEAFTRIRAENRTLATLFAFAPGPPVNLIVDGRGEVATTQFVSGDFFAALRVPPAAGRPLVAADDRAGAADVAVISRSYWLRRFGGSPSIVGKQVRLNAVAFTIVGVSGASLPDMVRGQGTGPDVTLPLTTEPAFQSGTPRIQQPMNWWLVVMGRLAPGHTPAQVEANLAPAFGQAASDAVSAFVKEQLSPAEQQEAKSFGFGRVPRLHVVEAARGVYDPWPYLRAPITILTVLAGIVLVVVCANLTNLSMALTTERQRELAVRHALGATRARVARQVLTEHAVMAMIGGSLAGLAGYWFQHVIRTFLPAAFDWRVVALAFALALVSGIAIGIIPALDAARLAASRDGVLRRRSRLAAALLVGQVALSLVLLVGAGLFMRTLANLQHVDPGFDTRNLVTFTLDPSTNQYDQPRATALFEDISTRLDALPGVSGVTFSSQPLLHGTWNNTELFTGNAAADKPNAIADSITIRENFFETIGIRLMAGRSFTARDAANAPLVAVVNETLARRLFGTADAIGRRFGVDKNAPSKYEVVGVVADARAVTLRRNQSMTVYWPHRQSPAGARTIEVRTTVAPESVMPAIRKAMDSIDPAIPIIALSTQASAIEDQWARERTIAMASTTLGTLALAVSMVGLFGLASYRVARRRKEIAIRMAVGAEARIVLRAALRESLALVSVGVALGLIISLSTTRFLRAQLFGLVPNDPGVLTGAVLILVALASMAGYLPARRAARLDPMSTLRDD